ncbi:ABC transporter permease [Pseudoduganella sp. LjRoot289]|uniref:FtsX-like permease family protein n=1 Tax=Pseudoduganella sp. LjRoot289 TaxID=3342314 RepID=UPI003ECD9577
MKAADFRIGWRLLLQERAYSAVTILGLALGFAACFLLLGYVRYCFSYDSHVPQADQVHLIKVRINVGGNDGWAQAVPGPLLQTALDSGLAQAAGMAFPGKFTLRMGDVLQMSEVMIVSPGMQQVLDLRAVEGDLRAALTRPDAIALTRSRALQLLGSTSVIGKTLNLQGEQFTVLALLADPPAATSLPYGALAGIDGKLIPQETRDFFSLAWGGLAGSIFVRLAPGTRPDTLRRALQDAFDNSPLRNELPKQVLAQLGDKKIMEVALTPLPDMYFDSSLTNRPGAGAHGDMRAIAGVAAVALLILLLAVTNYVNLASVRAMRRQGEIAMRKVLGASALRIAGQFIAESLLVALLATAGGLLLAWLLLPSFAQMMDRPLEAMLTPVALLASVALGVTAGVLAGLYPAWVALRMHPAQALAGRDNQETVGTLWLRRAVTVLQMTAAMGLTSTTLAVAWQTRYASSADPGFDPSPLLVLELPVRMSEGDGGRGLRDALIRVPGVQGVATAPDPVGQRINGNHIAVQRAGGTAALLMERSVSPNFFQVYGAQPLAGRAFDPQREREDNDSAVMLNASAALALGFATPRDAVGQFISVSHGKAPVNSRVIGIAPDLRYQSLRQKPEPIVYRNSLDATTMTVRYQGDLRTLEQAAETLWRSHLPTHATAIRRASGYFAENYADDLRLAQLLAAASMTATLLAAFGIYVLSAYSVQRRTREIVLRKLYGANRRAIARLLGREFLLLTGVAALLGLPLAAVAIARYLASFVEQAPVGGWTLAVALALIALVALAATARHTLAALRMSPALALRS